MTNIKPLSFFNIRIWSFTLYITVKLDLDGLRDKKKKKNFLKKLGDYLVLNN